MDATETDHYAKTTQSEVEYRLTFSWKIVIGVNKRAYDRVNTLSRRKTSTKENPQNDLNIFN